MKTRELVDHIHATHNELYAEDGELHSLITDGLLVETPLVVTHDPRVYAKVETGHTVAVNGQELATGAFKYRGALIAVRRAQLRNPELATVTAGSAGNHGIGVAAACYLLGLQADIYTPFSLSEPKRARLEAFGAKIHDDSNDVAKAVASAEAAARVERDAVFIHPYDNADVVAGQGTAGRELAYGNARFNQSRHTGLVRPTIFVGSVGGGGLVAGTAVSLERARRRSMISRGSLVVAAEVADKKNTKWIDGTAAKTGKLALRILNNQRFVQERMVVSEAEVAQAMGEFEAGNGRRIEPATAVGYAAVRRMLDDPLLANYNFTFIESGNNVSDETWQYASNLAG